MRKTFLFLMLLAGSCFGITGCIGALGGILPGIVSEVGFSVLSAILSSALGGIIPATT
ncbi:MAG: hypothetical protein WC975_08250 [Phycisphaerae bacterium]